MDGIRPTLEVELGEAMARLRGCVLEVFAEVGADPAHPREASRLLGLDKSLAWKFCRIAQTADAIEAAPLVPGTAGVRIALEAFRGAGIAETLVGATQRAVQEFDRVVKLHTGDRRTLDLVVSNLGTNDRARREQQRKQSYEGNSATWGVQARTQLTTTIVAPNTDDPTRCDIARVGGVIDFRRLRPDASWLLFRRYDRNDDGTAAGTWESLDENFRGVDQLPMLGQFSSQPTPRVVCTQSDGECVFELPAGRIGNTATITCIYGAVARSIFPMVRDEQNRHIDFATNLMTPVEMAVIDVLIHDAFAWARDPECSVLSLLNSGAIHAEARRSTARLPVDGELLELGSGVQSMASSRVPRYRQMLEDVFDRLGWNPDEFHGLRYEIAYPPIPTAAMLSFELPEQG